MYDTTAGAIVLAKFHPTIAFTAKFPSASMRFPSVATYEPVALHYAGVLVLVAGDSAAPQTIQNGALH